MISKVNHRTSARSRTPYGTLAVSPKYTVCSYGRRSLISASTVSPPTPESKTPMGRGSLTGSHYIRFVSYLCLCRPKQRKTARYEPGGVVEAAGLEPASASAPSTRFYERSSRFRFACLGGPGRRREASPLGVPPEPRDQDPGGEPTQ